MKNNTSGTPAHKHIKVSEERDYGRTITSLSKRGWTRAPQTVEQLIETINALKVEFQSLADIPYEYSVTISHSMILDLCKRLVALEKEVRRG